MERNELARDNDNSQRSRIRSQPCPNHMTCFCEWAMLHTFQYMPESDCERVVVTPFTLPKRYFHANKAIYAGGQIWHRLWHASKTNATMSDAVSTPNTIETLREQMMLVFFVSPEKLFRSASAQRRAHMTHTCAHRVYWRSRLVFYRENCHRNFCVGSGSVLVVRLHTTRLSLHSLCHFIFRKSFFCWIFS